MFNNNKNTIEKKTHIKPKNKAFGKTTKRN